MLQLVWHRNDEPLRYEVAEISNEVGDDMLYLSTVARFDDEYAARGYLALCKEQDGPRLVIKKGVERK